ncbi:MAG: 2-phospho-L-lactate guanylyltransferase [Acidobacteria bacterium]|nr:2-phospho-L-lactate guanylyltransferase [Acidobacteriota bacterium]
MRYILIPVKDLSLAKTRLAPLLTQDERMRLALAMIEMTFAASKKVQTIDRIAVVTNYLPAIALADKCGIEVIEESSQTSESESIDYGSLEVKKRGATAALRLPIDLPLMTAGDIETVLDCDNGTRTVVIVPSRDGTGTNAILRRPPDLIPSHFGPGSLAKHLAEIERVKSSCTLLTLPRIALDIDRPDDLVVLINEGVGSPLADLLAELNILDRMGIRA